MRQTTDNQALSDGVESAIDGLAVAVVSAAQTQTEADAPAVANAIGAAAGAQADAIGRDAYAQADYATNLAKADALFVAADAQGNETGDTYANQAQANYNEVRVEYSVDYNVWILAGVTLGLAEGPVSQQDLVSAADILNSQLKQAAVYRVTVIGLDGLQSADQQGAAETTFAATEGQIEIDLTAALGTISDGLAGTLATDDEAFTTTVAQAASGAAQTLAGDEQTWTDTVDPAEVGFVTTQGSDEVTSAQGIAAAEAVYALANAPSVVGYR